MDQPQSAERQDAARITLTPEMRPMGPAERAPRQPDALPAGRQPIRRSRFGRGQLLLSVAAMLLGLAGLGAAVWTHADANREILRLSTELAQLRVSLDLYARNAGSIPANTAPDTAQLTELGNRLAILEQNWRGGAVPAPTTTPAPAAAGNEDCLPAGMRILVAAGDRYPVCEQNVAVEIGVVDNGYLTLTDGTTIASGGSLPLVGTGCTLGVLSDGDEGLTGYAEIRVNC